MKLKYLEVEKRLKSKLNQFSSAAKQRPRPNELLLETEDIKEEEGQDVTNKRESTYLFGGSLRRILQSSPSLWFQQHKKTILIRKRVFDTSPR